MNTERVKRFIENNINLIEENTEESWKQLYSSLRDEACGEFTEVILTANIDPTSILGFIPREYLFYSSVKEYIVTSNITSIGSSAFAFSSLSTIQMSNNLRSIGSYAFRSCKNLVNIVIPDSVVSIGDNAFLNCQNLKEVRLSNTLDAVSNEMFYNCSNLESITIPDTVVSIGDNAFCNCYELSSLKIGKGVVSIGKESFWKCTKLTNVTYQGTTQQWNSISKEGFQWNYGVPATKVICSDGEIEL